MKRGAIDRRLAQLLSYIIIYFHANLIYDISMKGSEIVIQTEQIRNLLEDNDMEQISHGVYASKEAWTDAMYLVYLRCKQAVFSHETALFFHDLTDREPMEYEITVKTGYNPSKLKEDGIKVYTVKRELYGEGIIMMQTSFGHLVPVYNMERSICDIIRNRNNTEIQTLQSALKQYAKRKDKNLRLLMQYATSFHVDKILRQYLEVLL